jgi:site-specific recombinase XerD
MANERITLKDACELLLQSSRASDRSPNSIRAREQDLAGLTPFIEAQLGRRAEELYVDEITPEAMIGAFGTWSTSRQPSAKEIQLSRSSAARSYSTASKARMRSTWKTLFDVLIDLEHLARNPMRAVDRVKVPGSVPKPLEHWEDDTIPVLLSYVTSNDWEEAIGPAWPARDYAIVLMLLTTGLRQSELLSLTVGSITGPPEHRVLRVIGKGSKPRAVPVARELDLAVADYLADRATKFYGWKRDDRQPLFVARHAKRGPETVQGGRALGPGQLTYLLDNLLRHAGLGGRKPQGALTHAFRHTFGSQMASAGTPMADIAAIMGHANLQTTRGYTDSTDRARRAAIEANPILSSPLVRERAKRD